MNYYEYAPSATMGQFMQKVYGWMGAGLGLTALMAGAVASNPAVMKALLTSWPLLIGLFIAQIGLVVYLSGFITRMSHSTAVACFLGYSALTGVTLSGIFYAFTFQSIALAFGITAATFVVMALYGYFTKSDLSTIGSIALMGLFGVIIASLVNLYFKSAMTEYIISLAGVGIFTLLIAYDVQKIKGMAMSMIGQGELISKVAIVGALMLYLDFINLFLFILRLLGQRRED